MDASIDLMLRERIGLDPVTLGATTLARAIAYRMTACSITTDSAYANHISTDQVEWDALLDELLVPETWFFRGGRNLYDALVQFVRASIANTPSNRVIRIVSIPCSTGEEAYSLVMALEESGVRPDQYCLVGVDLSERHLARARAGVYTAFSFREQESTIKQRWFQPVLGDHWQIDPQIRSSVRFVRGNILESQCFASDSPYDLILCRNLFIYLTQPARRLALTRIDHALATDGRLCMTPAEAHLLSGSHFVSDGLPAFAIYRKDSSRAVNANSIISMNEHRESPMARGKKQVPRETKHAPPPTSPGTVVNQPASCLKNESELQPRELADAGRIVEALAALNHLMNNRPATADDYSLRGVIQLAAGQRQEAALSFRSALYLNPNHREALHYSILVHDLDGNFHQSALLRQRLARIDEGDES